jgi:hypothetical protein
VSYGEWYNGSGIILNGTYTGSTTMVQPTITWVQDVAQIAEIAAVPEPAPKSDDDPIAWLKGRVQETIDEVNWQEYKAA